RITSRQSQPLSLTSLAEVGSHCPCFSVFILREYTAKIAIFCTFVFLKKKLVVCEWGYEKGQRNQFGVFQESGGQ
ncbi:MAG: hypothetical protein K2I90_10625, partial [Odoribacter sp.]|nr:hypothetical protein [Odoribacter sp.]